MKKTLYVDSSVFVSVSENEMEEVNGGTSCANATNSGELGGYPYPAGQSENDYNNDFINGTSGSSGNSSSGSSGGKRG
jgi:hypothetical protein